MVEGRVMSCLVAVVVEEVGDKGGRLPLPMLLAVAAAEGSGTGAELGRV